MFFIDLGDTKFGPFYIHAFQNMINEIGTLVVIYNLHFEIAKEIHRRLIKGVWLLNPIDLFTVLK